MQESDELICRYVLTLRGIRHCTLNLTQTTGAITAIKNENIAKKKKKMDKKDRNNEKASVSCPVLCTVLVFNAVYKLTRQQ